MGAFVDQNRCVDHSLGMKPRIGIWTSLVGFAILLVFGGVIYMLVQGISSAVIDEDDLIWFEGQSESLLILRDGDLYLWDGSSLLFVSSGDVVVGTASFAPNGHLIAYFSKEDRHVALKIVDVELWEYRTLKMVDLVDSLQKPGVESWEFCEWSPLSWSSDSRYIALFVCGTEDSNLIYVDLLKDEALLVPYSSQEGGAPRVVQWMDLHEVVYSADSEIRVFDIQTLSSWCVLR